MSEPPPLPADRTRSRTVNLITSILFLLLATWTLVADLRFPVDMLLQSSASSVLLALFVSVWLFAAVITSAFPKRIVIAASILVTLRVGFGWPLNHLIGNTPAAQIISSLIFVLAAGYLFGSLKSWPGIAARPWFQLKHFFIMLAFWLIFGVVSLVPVGLGVLQGLDNFAGTYVDLSIKGVSLKERIFEKGDSRVRLTGMVHIADPSFYQTLAYRQSPPPSERHLVLTEGVSDRDEILPESFRTGQTYAKLAAKLGLEPQGSPRESSEAAAPIVPPGMTYLNADSDISDLPQKHQDLLVKLLTFIDEAELFEMFTMPDGVTALDVHDLFMVGLLKSRNDHLMAVMDQEMPGYDEVHIPWGAAHLPDIEERLLQRGYTMVEETDQPAIDFLKGFN
ncbi:hypothetical protein [Haloferula rosea]|uniref:Uncharacterized protein n=1 Tax=Haloferula rosea TaxID=490093 RepID=A0A934RDH2_9BACT|nr:hypothetical protein [Haloferula rosea]MBK1828728.1 hypothetical protein [Haloferula rosea]